MVYYSFLLLTCVCCVMSVQVRQITEPLFLGEGPHWDHRKQALYFVTLGQFNNNMIHKYVLATGVHTMTRIQGRIGFIVPVQGTCDQFLLGVDRQFQVVRWNGQNGSPATVLRIIGEVDRNVLGTSINDGKVDPRGRVFAGTISPGIYPVFIMNQGSLYRLNRSNITKVQDRITVSNGLAWDLRRKAMYYVDSWEWKIRRYDYDVKTGAISNLTYIFDFKKNNVEGFPDGMTIDKNGNLWVACFEGGKVIKVNPRTGDMLQEVPIPAKQVTSVTFGGPNFDILFVTSANFYFRGPQDGATFMVTGLGVKGLPNRSFKL
ncbi:hypothetical protein PYW08_003476 [Mythimna loreyi]|uniref:Uncharacterized protein n=1 Tax=Mythimna loreyi TaxID=667449 RepID=A0ACC2QTW6_9NEOP|nr:hypothetical protein PYW08_003476 [Mythimna loreyi]